MVWRAVLVATWACAVANTVGGFVVPSVIDHIRDASLGLKDICLYDRMPILGILHLFTIRGWGTLFSAIGMLAWVSGCARRLTVSLRKLGMNVHYYKQLFNSSTLQFGGVKAKGYDSVRIMTVFIHVLGWTAATWESLFALFVIFAAAQSVYIVYRLFFVSCKKAAWRARSK